LRHFGQAISHAGDALNLSLPSDEINGEDA